MKYRWKRQNFGFVVTPMIVLLMLFIVGSSSKSQNDEGLYSGGSGETIEEAVVINASNSLAGIAAEYHYVSNKCGRRNVDWKLKLQAYLEKDGRHYDLLTVELKSGEVRSFYFDITAFYGKF